MDTAVAYRDSNANPGEYGLVRLSADDMVRLGIIAYGRGDKAFGWLKITEALLGDESVLDRDSAYAMAPSGH